MSDVITDKLDLWTSTLLTKSTAGRGSNGKGEAYGIKKLRELILELAVRGKLVPQDPGDEPASTLLKEIVFEKKRLIKERLIRDAKAPLYPNEPPNHDLPTGWVWTCLYELGDIAPRNEAEDEKEASFVPMQLISEKYGVPVQHEVKPWAEIKNGFTHFKEEDVVLAKITPCFQNGKSAVMRGLTNGFGAGTTELHVYRAVDACTVPEYVLIYLKSPRFIGDGIPKMTGTAGQKRITRDYFAGNHFPLPPLAEQHRIVAKVDELMALCDQLEQQQTTSIEAHQTLVETLLGTLTNVESQKEFNEAWTRIADHFDTLFTTEQSVDRLKQTILQLAVMGKLVPQDPNDEPAGVLLERIAKEKERLVSERKLKAQKPLLEINEQEKLFPSPVGWEWVRLGSISEANTGYAFKSTEYTEVGTFVLRVTNINPDGSINHDDKKFIDPVAAESTYVKFRLNTGDVLLVMVGGSLGKLGIVSEDCLPAVLNQNMWKLDRFGGLPVEYFLMGLKYINSNQLKITNSTHGHLAQGEYMDKLVPLPPLAEQHRIVVKVDELMAQCDSLKARLADTQTTKLHLADAIVEQAVT